jgi:hypothetical protein
LNLLQRIVTPAFVAFNSHCWFAYAVIVTAAHFHAPIWWVVSATIVLAGIKEYWCDKHYELAQTFVDDSVDFVGYLTGIGLGVWLVRFSGSNICATHFL